jgi:polysaccharide deacetylase family protein (PEP-CTERM system associated)
VTARFRPRPRAHLLTIALEDYFHVGAFNRVVRPGQWSRFDPRVERNTLRTLDLLDRFGSRATFFVLGWVADQRPDLVREVVARGHEVASLGYHHRTIGQMTPEEFRSDLRRAGQALERATGRAPLGYRVADGTLGPGDGWALEMLAEEGYAYDSSMMPALGAFWGHVRRRVVHQYRRGEHTIWEVPRSSVRVLGLDVPIAGGNYFRQLPAALVQRAVDRWDRTSRHPFVMYFHVWELDPEQPRIARASRIAQVRHYRNLDRMEGILARYLRRYRFTSIVDHLGLADSISDARPVSAPTRAQEPVERSGMPRGVRARALPVVGRRFGKGAKPPPSD